jgi:hypothetical protein
MGAHIEEVSMRLQGFAFLVIGMLASIASAQDRADLAFFESSIRPLLIENCYSMPRREKSKKANSASTPNPR